MSGRPATAVPLSRNRDFQLLWLAQTGSELSQHVFLIAYPLLAVALTDLPIAAGLLGFLATGVQLAFGLPAGLLADRYDRRLILVLASAARALAHGSLAVAIWLDAGSYLHLLAVAIVEGLALAAIFPAEEAALPQVVTTGQLPDAIALNTARSSVGQMGGNSLGGVLYGLTRALPFAANAVLQLLATLALLFVRIPRHHGRETSSVDSARRFWPELTGGLRWLLRHPTLRVITACGVLVNLGFGAFLTAFILIANAAGVPSGQVGVVVAMLGGGALVGALLAGRLQRVLRPYVSISAVLWGAALLTPLLALTSNMVVAGVVFALVGALVPLANTTIITYQLVLTPDGLRGRVSAAVGVFDNVAAALGPLVGSVLVQFTSGRTALFGCAALLLVPAVLAALNRTLRRFSGHTEEDDGKGEVTV
ncbi:MFS transporter [Saccharothrix sp. AJ9571]|nr:MFS transporter [Saccharothrix sp. AJ9571]